MNNEATESICVANIYGAKHVNCFKTNLKTKGDPYRAIGFRIHVYNKYAVQLVSPDVWGDGIVIKPWKFKPN